MRACERDDSLASDGPTSEEIINAGEVRGAACQPSPAPPASPVGSILLAFSAPPAAPCDFHPRRCCGCRLSLGDAAVRR